MAIQAVNSCVLKFNPAKSANQSDRKISTSFRGLDRDTFTKNTGYDKQIIITSNDVLVFANSEKAKTNITGAGFKSSNDNFLRRMIRNFFDAINNSTEINVNKDESQADKHKRELDRLIMTMPGPLS